MNKKRNVHMIPHTHWDREWYYSSISSKAMVYWDLKYVIEHLTKNPKSKFTYDGQTSIIDDFLDFAPEWKDKITKVIKSKQLLVGPWYTQTDNLQPLGESIIRNLEIGGEIAKDFGHRMNVGYLPDSFGHNPQTPQIMKMVGIDNFTFYRGIDPKKIDNKLYFEYVAPSGDSVLGIWQTHYFTSSKWDTYDGFMKTGFKDRKTSGEVTVESYAKRSLDLPFWIAMGGDMREFKPNIENVVKQLNQKNNEKYNFIISDYESLVENIKQEIKEQKTILKKISGDLRASYTGRAHRTIMSARMDLKQKLFELENILLNNVEPLSLIAAQEGIDVPWKMIERSWKDVFKSSAHDSYGGSIEDLAYRKLMQRLEDAILIARGVSSMLIRIWANKEFKITDNNENLYILNTKPGNYTGKYEIKLSFDKVDTEKFKEFDIFDGKKQIPYFISKTEDASSHNRTVHTVVMFIENLKSFNIKQLKIKYRKNSIQSNKSNFIENDNYKIEVIKNKINVIDKKNKKEFKNVFYLEADASNGDTYDHSPITWNDKTFLFDSISIINNLDNQGLKTIELKIEGNIPNGLNEWESNKTSIKQDAKVIISLIKDQVQFYISINNKSANARVKAMFNTGSEVKEWEHDMQFATITKQVNNEYMDNWEQEDINGDKWMEYPSNLAPHQSYIHVKDNNFAISTYGSKEHEVININKNAIIALTLYRALDVFSKGYFLYRPGRPSGMPSLAPEAQLFKTTLEFKVELFTDKISNDKLFNSRKRFDDRPYLIESDWTLENVLPKFGTDLDYYATNNKTKLLIPSTIPKGMYLTAMYKAANGKMIARFLNVSDKEIYWDLKNNYSFNVYKSNTPKKIKIHPWKLINIFI